MHSFLVVQRECRGGRGQRREAGDDEGHDAGVPDEVGKAEGVERAGRVGGDGLAAGPSEGDWTGLGR
jgi:hypothetical protein